VPTVSAHFRSLFLDSRKFTERSSLVKVFMCDAVFKSISFQIISDPVMRLLPALLFKICVIGLNVTDEPRQKVVFHSSAELHVPRVYKYDAVLLLRLLACTAHIHIGWRRGVVVSGVRRMNEVNARRARLVPGWVTVFERVYHLGM